MDMIVRKALREGGGNKTKAARAPGIPSGYPPSHRRDYKLQDREQ